MERMSDYRVQADSFLERSGTDLKIVRVGDVRGFPFDQSDKQMHHEYRVTMNRCGQSYSFPFYDCAANFRKNKRPTSYDVLACLEKYPVASDVWEFAKEFGYTIDSKESFDRVSDIRNACDEQYKSLMDLFGENWMAGLREIN